MTAIALIDYGKLSQLDAIEFVRKFRKGALNKVQVDWLLGTAKGETFKKRKKLSLFKKLFKKYS